jgi:hypothetical protein
MVVRTNQNSTSRLQLAHLRPRPFDVFVRALVGPAYFDDFKGVRDLAGGLSPRVDLAGVGDEEPVGLVRVD